jgi:hypothetical protein
VTPYQQARAVYEKEPCVRTFEQDLRLHYKNGHVFETADYFVMGREVVRDAAASLIVDPSVIFPNCLCDCWHIYLFSGDMVQAWQVLNGLRSLPWFSFERRNELRFYKASRIERLSLGT